MLKRKVDFPHKAMCLVKLFVLSVLLATVVASPARPDLSALTQHLLASMGLPSKPSSARHPFSGQIPHYVQKLYREAARPVINEERAPKEVRILRSAGKHTRAVVANIATAVSHSSHFTRIGFDYPVSDQADQSRCSSICLAKVVLRKGNASAVCRRRRGCQYRVYLLSDRPSREIISHRTFRASGKGEVALELPTRLIREYLCRRDSQEDGVSFLLETKTIAGEYVNAKEIGLHFNTSGKHTPLLVTTTGDAIPNGSVCDLTTILDQRHHDLGPANTAHENGINSVPGHFVQKATHTARSLANHRPYRRRRDQSELTSNEPDRICQLESLRISIRSSYLKDIILQPHEYDAHQCVGRCSSGDAIHQHFNSYGLMKESLLDYNRSAARPITCIESQFRPLLAIISSSYSQVEITPVQDMIAEGCTCR